MKASAFRPGRAVLAALAGLLLTAAAQSPASPADPAPNLIVAPPNGLRFPQTIGEMERIAVEPGKPGDPDIAVYAIPTLPWNDQRTLAIAVGKAETAPPVKRMRDGSRKDGRRGEGGSIVSEGPFVWPGHVGARTFHGSYKTAGAHAQFWHAWDAGYGIIVIARVPIDEPERMERLAAAIVTEIFGGTPAR